MTNFPEKLYRVLDDPSSGEECTSSDLTAGAHLLGMTNFPEWDFFISFFLLLFLNFWHGGIFQDRADML